MDKFETLLNSNIATYEDVEAFLYTIPKFTSKTELNHTRILLEKLGNPMEKVPKIHVAGTNGKGSVCAYLQSLFCEYGFCVGGFISPHLVTIHERFSINKKPVEDGILLESFHEVFSVSKKAYLEEKIAFPTFFEFLFLMGMVIYEKCGVELLVLETGLGGRLDATNVFEKTEVCVLTTIGLDHCQYLGNTLVEIAGEKAGIIKEHSSVVFRKREDDVTEVFEKTIKKRNAVSEPVEAFDSSFIELHKLGIDFYYKSQYYSDICLTVSTNALYQVDNATLALRAFEVFLRKNNLKAMTADKMKKAISDTFWEGRMEEVLPGVFFDGAHNENGMKAFVESVNAIPCNGKRVLCFSAVNDKDYGTMIQMLYESHLFSKVVAVEMEEERGIHMDELKTYFSLYSWEDVQYIKGTEKGLQVALEEKNEEDLVFIVGSLYLIGLVKGILRRHHCD